MLTCDWHQTFPGYLWQGLGKQDSKRDGHKSGKWREWEGWATRPRPDCPPPGLKCPGYRRFMKQLLKFPSWNHWKKKKKKVKNHFVSKKVKGYSQNWCLINLPFLALCMANRLSTHSKKSQFTVVTKHQSGVPGGSQSWALRLFKALKNTSSCQMCR